MKVTELVLVFAVVTSQALAAKVAKKGLKAADKSCQKYDLILTKMNVCDGSAITFKDFNLTLTEDCRIIPKGCITTNAFKTAQVSWHIQTNARISKAKDKKGTADGCKQIKKIPGKIRGLFEAMKLSTSCPMPAGESCADEKSAVSIQKYKDYIWLGTGTTRGIVNVTYDTGKACVEFEVNLKNKNFQGGRMSKTPTEILDGRKNATHLLKNVLGGNIGTKQ